ncbi:MAG: glycosyltransferase, partial [bacterium]
MESKKALIIAYHLPPMGGIPVMRSLRLVKYLGQFNWTPVVLTSKNGFDVVHGHDVTLLSKLTRNIEIIRIDDFMGRLLNWLNSKLSSNFMLQIDKICKTLFFPDEKILWGLRAFFQAKRIIQRRQAPDVIYATGFPWSSLLLGYWLKRALKKPLVLDLRDAWSLSPMPVWRKFKLHGWLERRIMAQADANLFTSEGTTRQYQQLYPDLAPRMTWIYNGYDPADFNGQRTAPAVKKDGDGKLTLIYAGSLSDTVPPRDRSRSLAPVLKGLQQLRTQRPELYQKMALQIYSNEIPNTRRLAEKLGLMDVVEFQPRLPHRQIVPRLQAADLLILIVRPSRDAEQMAPAKLYEYVAAGKPVLTLAPRFSEAAKIVQKYDLGPLVSYENAPAELADAICKWSVNGKWPDTC